MMNLEWAGLLRRTRSALALTLAVIAQHAHAAGVADSRKAGDIVMETGSGETPEGKPVPYEIGTVFVPENRAAPHSRLIGVGFARIRAARPTGGPPIFVMTGGPGSSLLSTLTDGDMSSRRRLALWATYSASNDLVVVDQRGYSTRGEVLEFTTPKQPLDQPGSLAADADTLVKSAHEAVVAHPGKDLTGYTIVQSAEDVNDLRQALGYRQITLYGASFGSQWSLAVMRLHPEIVARALLTDVEPLDYAYDMPSHVFAALQRIAWDADRDPGLAPYLPKDGVMGALRAVRDRLAKSPLKIKVKDETTGKTQTVTLGLQDFQDSLLRSADTWPAFILSLYHRHYDGWAREVIEQRQSQTPSALIGPLFDTSLGVSAEREHLLRTDSGTDLIGMGAFHSYIASAPAWPSPDVGDTLRLMAPSPIPVLFVHGDWDTSTPIENLLNLLPYFPNGRAILVHRGTHGDRKPLREQHPALWAQLVEFFKTGDTRNIPVNVTLRVPVFQQPPFPAPAKSAL
ncbi:alpha/beta fold hydrolase [Stigmatella sp. ncwal1]|uniref:Alpha/beta fold hydrolase n=1 Tax=Stigmatella ashevillensis TaxID=2995309 RepID=A0ABT5D584_9BACT|nr:alpha/beta fold hydrolase [Stigmatella ashevillena]MDC0708726.1 alpha/beta fold hydrolase [Stigmatella ashevillena]